MKKNLNQSLNQNQNHQKKSETEEEEFLNVAQNDSDSCNCEGAVCYCGNHSIRVLSEDSAEILFSTIEHIKDDEARRNYLLELQKLVLKQKDKEVTRNVTPFSMKQIMQRYTDKKEDPD